MSVWTTIGRPCNTVTGYWKEEIIMAKIYTIDQSLCVSCGTCDMECRFGAILIDDQGKFSVDAEKCRGCGLCAASCPVDAALPKK